MLTHEQWVTLGTYGAVVALGCLVGVAEVITRYRDAPGKALRLPAALVYVSINGLAGLLALYLMRAFGWTFGGQDEAQQTVMQVLVAGLAAMAFLRSSLFTVRIGDTDVGVGPSALLTALLGAADRDIDQRRGASRIEVATRLMSGFDYDTHGTALLNVAFAAMQNLTPDEILATGKAVAEIDNMDSREEKAVSFGLLLLSFAGEGLVEKALAAITTAPPAPETPNPHQPD